MPRARKDDITQEGDPETVDTFTVAEVTAVEQPAPAPSPGPPGAPGGPVYPIPGVPYPGGPFPTPPPGGPGGPGGAAPDLAALVQMLAGAIQQGTQGAIEQTQPRRHSREDWEFENRSSLNPKGELHHPRPDLVCPTYYAVLRDQNDPNERGKAPVKLYPMERLSMTYEEIELANQLSDGRGSLQLNDNSRVPFEVYTLTDRLTGNPLERLVALPVEVYDKGRRGQLPPLTRLLSAVMAPASV